MYSLARVSLVHRRLQTTLGGLSEDVKTLPCIAQATRGGSPVTSRTSSSISTVAVRARTARPGANATAVLTADSEAVVMFNQARTYLSKVTLDKYS